LRGLFIGDTSSWNDSHYYSDRSTNAIEKATCKVLIGADGIKSTARDILFPTFKESSDLKHELNRKMFRAVLPREALKDVETMPPRGYTVTYRCDRTDSVFAIRQLAENVFGFTSAITQAQAQAHADDESATVIMEDNASARFERLKQCFKDYFKDVQQWINAVDKNAIDDNDIYDIDMLEQWSRGSCMLIGDACHVMSPSLGQGANVGLEDSSELAAALGQYYVVVAVEMLHRSKLR
jgi:2-polyprenyl-6-methoxyphenol hydroxylase-like FAD-dependent oxidoreductase